MGVDWWKKTFYVQQVGYFPEIFLHNMWKSFLNCANFLVTIFFYDFYPHHL